MLFLCICRTLLFKRSRSKLFVNASHAVQTPPSNFLDVLDAETYDVKLPDKMTVDGRNDESSGFTRHKNAVDKDEIAPPVGDECCRVTSS